MSVNPGGHTWNVYATGGNGYTAFVPPGGARLTSGTVDLKAMLNFLVAHGRELDGRPDLPWSGILDTGGKPVTWN